MMKQSGRFFLREIVNSSLQSEVGVLAVSKSHYGSLAFLVNGSLERPRGAC
jgi:hypothetical protein